MPASIEPEVDAIVVLGCRVEPGGSLSSAAARRCAAARDAFAQGIAGVVVASGGRRWSGHVEALRLREHLITLGVPAQAILVELCSLTTAENAIYTAALLRARRGGSAIRVAIATCSWHQARAAANFQRVGVHAEALSIDEPRPSLATRARRAVHEMLSLRLDLETLDRAGPFGGAFLPALDDATSASRAR